MRTAKDRRIDSVQRFGRYARNACTALFAFVAFLAAPWGLFSVITATSKTPVDVNLGILVLSGSGVASISMKVWLISILLGVLVVFLGAVWTLRRVFANLARGEIYSRANIHLLRQLGWLIVAGACFQLLVLVAMVVPFIETGIVEFRNVQFTVALRAGGMMTFAYAMVTAGILFLVSWITDIGLSVSEEADELRRDADLVI